MPSRQYLSPCLLVIQLSLGEVLVRSEMFHLGRSMNFL
jgi:hypothetical protein